MTGAFVKANYKNISGSLLHALVDHFLFGYNLNLSINKDQAIGCGLLAFQEVEEGKIEFYEEPLVKDAILFTLKTFLVEDYDSILFAIATTSYKSFSAKEGFLEYLVALDLSLFCRSHKETGKGKVRLGNYLSRFGISCPQLDVWEISNDIKPVRQSCDTNGTTFFRELVDDDAISKVYYDIDQICGCDVVFKVSHFTESTNHSTV